MKLSLRELGTVLAALRYWQRKGIWVDEGKVATPYEEQGIATDDGNYEPLDEDEIDELCERINS